MVRGFYVAPETVEGKSQGRDKERRRNRESLTLTPTPVPPLKDDPTLLLPTSFIPSSSPSHLLLSPFPILNKDDSLWLWFSGPSSITLSLQTSFSDSSFRKCRLLSSGQSLWDRRWSHSESGPERRVRLFFVRFRQTKETPMVSGEVWNVTGRDHNPSDDLSPPP